MKLDSIEEAYRSERNRIEGVLLKEVKDEDFDDATHMLVEIAASWFQATRKTACRSRG